ncbi:5-(carboxyamino)imidazole ribonucleotide synthase [Acuticoccus sediminis]|uniref:N5-carboxyaminoimidazole ribonucleotide synthase n=1 Tax=Acuticoccus sediminis TaxID=2184697 RepID=A0A8B2NMW2_9HYPH|nr:5-(carboxyamino)imidazole ribonucleotide synthase [Acuticoccus sediminis]
MILTPGATIGILGGGQLGRMLATAAAELGLSVHIYCPDTDPPAAAVAAGTTIAPYEDAEALARFAAAVDVVTYEFENVPVSAVEGLGDRVRPGPRALEVAQDRLTEKAFLAECGLPVAPHRGVSSPEEIAGALTDLGGVGILKTRRMGYDGKGQVRLVPGVDVARAFASIGEVPAIVEALVPFDAETSTVLARGADGRTAAYTAPANEHSEGILRRSTVPGPLTAGLEAEAQRLTADVAEALGYVGVLAIEWFVTGDPANPLVANEMAPRVHNTGHWTQDAAVTSQFENHIRAIAGWPLGSTARTADAVMLNLIGHDADDWQRHLDTAGAKLHLYGKRDTRPGRKMGHVNVLSRGVDFRAGG